MRKRIRDIRHEELIEATIAAIHLHGFAAVTISQIAAEAGASVGSINYYFGSKDRLLEGTMQRLLTTLRTCTLDGLAQATTPAERLRAIVMANFDARLFTAAQCSVWMQFWASAPYDARLSRLHRINRARVSSNLSHPLRRMMPAAAAADAQNALQAYMDGVWLEASQARHDPDIDRTKANAARFLDAMIQSLAGPG